MRYEERNLENKINLNVIIPGIIKVLFYLEIFLLPLFFLPLTIEYYDTAKVVMMLGLNLIILIFLIINSAINNEWRIYRTSYDGLFLIFLALIFISTIFSSNQVTSFLGYYGRFYDTFLMFAGLVSFVYIVQAAVKNEVELDLIFIISVLSSLISGIIFLVGRYNILPGLLRAYPILAQQTFSTINDTITLEFYMIYSVIIASIIYLNGVEELELGNSIAKLSKVVFGAISSLIFFIILGLNTPSWIPVVICLVTFVYLFLLISSINYLSKRSLAYFIGLFVIGELIIVSLLIFGKHVNNPNSLSIGYNMDILKASWGNIKNVFLGTGPDTFYYQFVKNIPASYYVTRQYGIVFSKATTEFIQLAIAIGLFGIFSLISLFAYAIYDSIRIFRLVNDPTSKSMIAIVSSLIVATILVLFTQTGSVALYFPLFLSIATLIKVENLNSLTKKGFLSINVTIENYWDKKSQFFKTSTYIGISLIPIALLVILLNHYLVLMSYFKSVNDTNIKASYNDAAYAAEREPFVDNYQNQMAAAAVGVAQTLLQNESKLKQSQLQSTKNLISDLTVQAVRQDQMVLLTHPSDPVDLSASINLLSSIYVNVDNTSGYLQTALEEAQLLNSLYPNNISNLDLLGRIYIYDKDYKDAISTFEEVRKINTYNDNFNYDYAFALEGNGDYAQAIPIIKSIRDDITNKNSTLYQNLTKELQNDESKASTTH